VIVLIGLPLSSVMLIVHALGVVQAPYT